jgi:prevent-host-death family protein
MARTITAREANRNFSRLLAEVAAGESFVITRHGVPVARLAPEPAPDGRRRLTPAQEQALAESEAFMRSLTPRPPPADLPPDWPRSRDDIYDDIFRERSSGRGE